MRLDELPAAMTAAGARLRTLPDDLDGPAAQAVLDHAEPPRATGALGNSGHVVDGSVVFGSATVDYAAPVHKADPFLDRAVAAAMDTVLDLADAKLADAITL